MKPVKFKHANTEFAKDQPEYGTLPALRIDGPEGHVISCWKLSLWERIRILFFGCMWLNLISFNKPLTPSFLSVSRKEVFSVPEDSLSFLGKLKNMFK